MFVLDAYAARSCPVKTHNAFHPGLIQPTTEPSPRFPGSAEFTARVLGALVASHHRTIVDCRALGASPSAVQEEACLRALAEGADIIIGGLLPRDYAGHRSGRPDVLVRDRSPHGGYRPLLVKYQKLLDLRRDEAPFVYSLLDEPDARQEGTGFRYRWSVRANNVLQLAHHWRMLEGLGHAAPGRRWAGIVGTDDVPDTGTVITWVDLDEPTLPPNPGQPLDPEPALMSPLARYDHEQRVRVEIAERAADCSPDDPPLLRPIVTRECGWCPWWTVCRPQLDDDDLSLRISKSPLDAHEIAVLRDLGVTRVGDLAHADLDDLLPAYLPRVAHRPGGEDRLRLAQRRSLLLLDGIELDRTTKGPIQLPTADLEIDIDIETSRDERIYLWGFWVQDADGGEGYYRHFSAFRELDAEAEAALACEALGWLRAFVEGRDALVYHYSDYEVLRIERLAREHDEPVLSWARDFAHDRFVDLFAPVRQHFFGTGGLGLKAVARQGAGFTWRDDSPGGLNSMSWFDDAVRAESAAMRDRARTRVLEYNEDDVRATWHVRRWLRAQR